MTLDTFLSSHADAIANNIHMLPRLVMKDGFSISIQGSQYHYCSPREDLPFKEYTNFELGYPSEEEDLIAEYAEDEDLTNTVYGYVPKEVVSKVVEKHGGIEAVKNKYN